MASKFCPYSHEVLGVKTKLLENHAFSSTVDNFSGSSVGLDYDAGMSSLYSCIFLAIGRIKQGQAITVKFLGLMAAATNVIPFGLLYMKPLKRCLKTKGFPQEATNFA